MASKEEQVRILVVGDGGVGKTSLITTVVSTDFQEKVPPKIPPVLIPRKKDSDNVRTEIIDTSSKPADQELVESWILRADFICIIYDVNVPQTLQRVEEYWIPYIRKINTPQSNGTTGKRRKVPLAVVGTKTDVRDGRTNHKKTPEELEKEMMPLLNKFDDVEYVCECSAREKDSSDTIDELFWHAQYRVLFPRLPLCDADLNFTDEFVLVITRIFNLLDSDKDGYLLDNDIRTFQQVCFNETELDEDSVKQIKRIIQNSNPHGVNEKGLNEKGFITLFHIILERGRTETIWGVLRKFGYDKDLKLKESYYLPKLEVKKGDRVELSTEGIKFLTQLFMQYNEKTNAAILSRKKLNQLFLLCHEHPRHPWTPFGFPDCCATHPLQLDLDMDDGEIPVGPELKKHHSPSSKVPLVDDFDKRSNYSGSVWNYSLSSVESDPEESIGEFYDSITLRTWLSLWGMLTTYNHSLTVKYLAYLGFGMVTANQPNPKSAQLSWVSDPDTAVTSSAVTIHKARGGLKNRSMFLCYMFGSVGSRKNSIRRALLQKEKNDMLNRSARSKGSAFAVSQIKEDEGLIIEIPTERSEETKPTDVPKCIQDRERMNKADIFLLVIDNSSLESFQYIVNLQGLLKKTYPNTPSILVVNRAELPTFSIPKGLSNPTTFCKHNRMPPPILISNKNTGNLFRIIMDTIRRQSRTPAIVRSKGFTIFGITTLLLLGTCIYFQESLRKIPFVANIFNKITSYIEL